MIDAAPNKPENSAQRAPFVQLEVDARRHSKALTESDVTIGMCDLVASTTMSVELSPNELRDLLRFYYSVCLDEVEAACGRVMRYVGDGVMAVFVHDRNGCVGPENAVAASQRIRERLVRKVVPLRHGPRRLEVRQSIAAGSGICDRYPTGPGLTQEIVFGEVPFLAARLQDHAEPGQTVICETVAAAAYHLVDMRSIGEVRLRGFPKPRNIWRLRDRLKGHKRRQLLRTERIHSQPFDAVGRHASEQC